MHHRRALRVFVFGLLAAGVAALCPSQAAEGAAGAEGAAKGDETVIAKIGDSEVITKNELDRNISAIRQGQVMQAGARGIATPDVPEPTQAQKVELLDDMVSTRVLHLLAKDSGIAISDEDVNADIEQNKARLPQGMTFEDYLCKQGLTLEAVRENVRRRILLQRFTDEKTKDVAVSEAEVGEEYQRALERGVFDSVDFQHILIRVTGTDDAAWAKGKEAIDAAYKRIKDGEDFGKVAQEVSEDTESKEKGGAYTGMPHNPRRPEMDKVLFSAAVGEVAEPFKSSAGWHLVKVNARGPVSQEKASESIKMVMLRTKKQEAVKKIVDEARAKLKIEITMPPEVEAPAAPEPDAGKLLDKAI